MEAVTPPSGLSRPTAIPNGVSMSDKTIRNTVIASMAASICGFVFLVTSALALIEEGDPKTQGMNIQAARIAILAMDLDNKSRDSILKPLDDYKPTHWLLIPSLYRDGTPKEMSRVALFQARKVAAKRYICLLLRDGGSRSYFWQKIDNASTEDQVKTVLSEAKLLSAAGHYTSSTSPAK